MYANLKEIALQMAKSQHNACSFRRINVKKHDTKLIGSLTRPHENDQKQLRPQPVQQHGPVVAAIVDLSNNKLFFSAFSLLWSPPDLWSVGCLRLFSCDAPYLPSSSGKTRSDYCLSRCWMHSIFKTLCTLEIHEERWVCFHTETNRQFIRENTGKQPPQQCSDHLSFGSESRATNLRHTSCGSGLVII